MSNVDELLLGEGGEGVASDLEGALDGAGGGESPAGTALSLVLDGGDGALGGPVDGRERALDARDVSGGDGMEWALRPIQRVHMADNCTYGGSGGGRPGDLFELRCSRSRRLESFARRKCIYVNATDVRTLEQLSKSGSDFTAEQLRSKFKESAKTAAFASLEARAKEELKKEKEAAQRACTGKSSQSHARIPSHARGAM